MVLTGSGGGRKQKNASNHTLGEGVPLPDTTPADIKSEGRGDKSEMNKDRDKALSTALQGRQSNSSSSNFYSQEVEEYWKWII